MERERNRTVGQVLRAAREGRGISREEAAGATRIKPVFLVAMEDDDYHLLPDERYLLRFLAEYATFLHLDPQEVQRHFAQQIVRDRGPLAVFPVERTVTLSLRRLLPALFLLAFLIPALFIGISLLNNRAPEVQNPERGGRRVVGEAGPPMGRLPSTREIFATNPVATAAPALPDSPVPPAAGKPAYTLRVIAQEMTWMLITIDDHETRDVLLQAGETWEWYAHDGFIVTVGNAGGVALALNGRPLPRLGEPGQVIRDLRLPTEATPTPEFP